ncbi:MAG: hypothetical protein F6K02_01850 [Moorea sp. SIO3A5]|nr:hypothetical protein [Moorena sp. SIO3A5]
MLGILSCSDDSRFPIPDSRFPTPDSRFPIPDSRFPIPDSRLPIPDSLKNFLQNFSKYAIIICFLCYNKIAHFKINGKSQPTDIPQAKAGSGSHLKEIHLLCTMV